MVAIVADTAEEHSWDGSSGQRGEHAKQAAGDVVAERAGGAEHVDRDATVAAVAVAGGRLLVVVHAVQGKEVEDAAYMGLAGHSHRLQPVDGNHFDQRRHLGLHGRCVRRGQLVRIGHIGSDSSLPKRWPRRAAVEGDDRNCTMTCLLSSGLC